MPASGPVPPSVQEIPVIAAIANVVALRIPTADNILRKNRPMIRRLLLDWSIECYLEASLSCTRVSYRRMPVPYPARRRTTRQKSAPNPRRPLLHQRGRSLLRPQPQRFENTRDEEDADRQGDSHRNSHWRSRDTNGSKSIKYPKPDIRTVMYTVM